MLFLRSCSSVHNNLLGSLCDPRTCRSLSQVLEDGDERGRKQKGGEESRKEGKLIIFFLESLFVQAPREKGVGHRTVKTETTIQSLAHYIH